MLTCRGDHDANAELLGVQALNTRAGPVGDRVEFGGDGVNAMKRTGKNEILVGCKTAIVGHGGCIGMSKVLRLVDETACFVDDP